MTPAEFTAVHPFAGHGPAPYKLLKVVEKYTAAPYGPRIAYGVCMICANTIGDVYVFRAANGAEFEVGCDCATKADDDSYVQRQLKAHKAKLAAAKRVSKASKVDSELAEIMSARADELKAIPHPRGFAGLSMFDYATWMTQNAGAAGKAKLLKQIK